MVKILKHKYWLIPLVFFFLLRLPSLFEPYWYGDEGIYLTLGQGIRKGLTLYSQIYDNKPPLLYYLAAFGRSVFGFRLLLLIWMIPTIYAFFKLANKFFSKHLSYFATLIFLFITSIPLIEGNIANAEIFMLLPTILGIFYFYKATTVWQYFLASLFLGIAFTIKFPVIFEFIFIIAFLFLKKFNLFSEFSLKRLIKVLPSFSLDLFVMLSGFILPILLWAAYFASKSTFLPFLSAALLRNFSYVSSWSTGNQQSSFMAGGLMLRGLLFLAAFISVYFLVLKKLIDTKLAFLLFWFATSIFAATISGRPYPHYLIQILPPLCLLLLYFFSHKEKFVGLSIGLSLFFLTLTIVRLNFYFYPVLDYYTNFYSYAFHLDSKDKYLASFGSDINNSYKLAQYIKNNSSPQDKIFIWSDNSNIYALSDRLPASRFIVAYHVIDFGSFEDTANQLKANLPKFIIYSSVNQPFTQLDKFINHYYFISQVYDQTILFQLR
ncbi:MAG: hypothetical protein Q8P53_03500 [Candidatus Shapirobacteria bacterium]|nr:hypothetical protein [Candidatus Shapirobacteria bacterium]